MKKRSSRYWLNLVSFALALFLLASVGLMIRLAYTRSMGLVHPKRAMIERTPADAGLRAWEEVHFPSADGLQLAGWFIPSPAKKPAPALIYVHGLGGNREDLLDQAQLLHRQGYAALLFDLRNHGQSEGEITTLGLDESKDIRGAVDYLLTRSDIDPKRIGLVGHSMGGAVVIHAAASIPEVSVIIAESAYTSLEDNITQGMRAVTGLPPFPFAPLVIWFGEREAGMRIGEVRPIDDVANLSPRAILFIHGENDEVVDPSNSIRFFQAASQPKEIYLISGAGHGDFLSSDPLGFEQRLIRFLDMHLKKEGSRRFIPPFSFHLLVDSYSSRR